MTDLSPAAQAVLDALYLEELNGPQQILARAHAAAALYAAADQVVPYLEEPNWGAMRKRSQLLAIAAELRGQDQPSSEEH
jgi:hypothetical protein